MKTIYPLTTPSSVPLAGSLDILTPVVTPQQWADTWRRPSEPDPEHRLVWAVLSDAIRCAKAPPQSLVTRHQCEAEWWFESSSILPFSFLWCCEILGQDPGAIRRGLATMPVQKKIGRTRPIVRQGHVVAADRGRR